MIRIDRCRFSSVFGFIMDLEDVRKEQEC